MMTFSTELGQSMTCCFANVSMSGDVPFPPTSDYTLVLCAGRALEEMQTKDDDPESGEEVRIAASVSCALDALLYAFSYCVVRVCFHSWKMWKPPPRSSRSGLSMPAGCGGGKAGGVEQATTSRLVGSKWLPWTRLPPVAEDLGAVGSWTRTTTEVAKRLPLVVVGYDVPLEVHLWHVSGACFRSAQRCNCNVADPSF